MKHLDFAEEEVVDSSLLEYAPKVEVVGSSKQSVFIKSKVPEPPIATFDGRWSDDEEKDDDNSFFAAVENKSQQKPKQKRKPPVAEVLKPGEIIECKYCDTQFSKKKELYAHQCKYLICDRKNFICRYCNKQLDKKIFSEHIKDSKAHPMGFIEPEKEITPPVIIRRSRKRKLVQCGKIFNENLSKVADEL